MVLLRRIGAALLLVIGTLIALYGVVNTIQGLRTALSGSRAYGLGGMLGGLIVASIGYSIGVYGLKLWRRKAVS